MDSNDVVITNLPNEDLILGPLLRYGSPKNRAPWFDDRNKAFADYQGALLSTNFPDYWNTFATGTVQVDPMQICGNSAAGFGVIGTGTHFTSLFKYATSTTSQSIATGSKTFTTQAGLGYTVGGSYARVTSSANPANFMAGAVTAYTGTSLTIDVNVVGGSGTHTDWGIVDNADGTDQYIVFAWNAGANRRLNQVDSVFSDTCLILHYVWDGGTTESGLSYAIPSNTYIFNWGKAQQGTPGNYYDNVEAFKSFYRRSGIDSYWTYYTTLADNHWHQPAMDQGRAYSPQSQYSFAVRSQSLQGMMLRAQDSGMSGMWTGIRLVVANDTAMMNTFIPPGWAFIDQREYAAYPMLFDSLDAILDPDQMVFAATQRAALSMIMPYFTVGLNADGSFPSSFFTVANQTDSAVFTQGSKTVTCATCSWPDGGGNRSFSGAPITIASATAANPMVLSLPANVPISPNIVAGGGTSPFPGPLVRDALA